MLGHTLEAFCRSAAAEILLVAPFTKFSVVERLLACATDSVAVTCITRWWPQEIAAGVTDLEVWELFRGHPRHTMFLRHDLHAKLYKADDQYLVGSANLTGRALGYTLEPNLELLVAPSANDDTIVAFEHELWRAAIAVDDELHQTMTDFVAALDWAPQPLDILPGQRALPAASVDLATWVPRTRQPEDLSLAYRGANDLLSAATLEAACADLAILQVPPGLLPEAFRRAVGSILLQMPVAHALDTFIAAGERRFGAVADLLKTLNPDGAAERDWQTLLRWFTYFQPGRYTYRRPRHSELIGRAP